MSASPDPHINSRRSTLVLGLFVPGLGQACNGEILKGLTILAASCALPLLALRGALLLPDARLVPGLGAALLVNPVVTIAAALAAMHRAARAPRPASAARRFVYLLVGLALFTLCFQGLSAEILSGAVREFRIPTDGMEPALRPGDVVLTDGGWYERTPPRVGDIAVFERPSDGRPALKRIAALPGQTVSLPEGGEFVVPAGRLFLLGDNRPHSVDSRSFGPVPIRNLTGRVRLICFSLGPEGVRWGRIGLAPSDGGR